MQRIPNTQLGHRLMTYAFPFGLQHELAEVLFRYYFVEGQDVRFDCLDVAQYLPLTLARIPGSSFAENQLVSPERLPSDPRQKVNRLNS